MCGPPSWRPLREELLLLGSVSGDAFAQLTYRESLRDIETCLGAVGGKLYHLGFRTRVARSTLADANESRNQRGSGGGLENGCGGGCAELRGTHAPSGRRLACE
jgi:hypothetical protein